MTGLDTKISDALYVLDRATKRGPLLLAYSGGKDALVVALLMIAGNVDFMPVCETSFYFARQEEDIRKTASALGLTVKWRCSRDLDWVRRHPEILFADESRIRSWSFLQRQQKVVAKEQSKYWRASDGRGSVAVFGRRRQENTVRGTLYSTIRGWQCHPLCDWSTEDVWLYLKRASVPAPWIYTTRFGELEGNAPFYTLRAKDVGGVEEAWSLVASLDPRYSREAVLG